MEHKTCTISITTSDEFGNAHSVLDMHTANKFRVQVCWWLFISNSLSLKTPKVLPVMQLLLTEKLGLLTPSLLHALQVSQLLCLSFYTIQSTGTCLTSFLVAGHYQILPYFDHVQLRSTVTNEPISFSLQVITSNLPLLHTGGSHFVSDEMAEQVTAFIDQQRCQFKAAIVDGISTNRDTNVSLLLTSKVSTASTPSLLCPTFRLCLATCNF